MQKSRDSSYLMGNRRDGHLEALYLIVHFLWKTLLKRVVFDPSVPLVNENEFRLDADWTEFYGDVWEEDPPDMPEPLGSVDHAGNIVTRKSHSGIMISVNNALIKSFSKMQNTMESSTYDSEMVLQ